MPSRLSEKQFPAKEVQHPEAERPGSRASEPTPKTKRIQTAGQRRREGYV